MIDETTRQRTLRAYAILDSPPEAVYDDLVQFAADLCATPMAVFTLVDETRQWFKASVGIDFQSSPREFAFCAHVLVDDQPLVIADASQDPRFATNPLVTAAPGIRFYAGIPLAPNGGPPIGTLAVLDVVPRTLTPEQFERLQALARQAIALLELRLEKIAHRQTLERLDAAQQVAQVGSWELVIAENRLTWTAQVYAIFGVEEEQFTATFEAFLAFVHPDDRAEFLAAQARALNGEAPLDVEHRIIRPDGTLRSVRERAQLIQRDELRGPLLVGTVQDVTFEAELRRQRRREQLVLSEALSALNFHMHNSPLAVIEWDADFRVTRWTTQSERLFGWAEAVVLGRHPNEWNFIHPDDRQAFTQVIGALIDGGARSNVSLNRNLAADGRVLHCEWYNSARHATDGRLLSILSFAHDVTERVAIEQANRELLAREKAARADAEQAKAHFRALFEAAPGLYLVIEPEHYGIVAVSDAYLAATMTERAAIIGRPLFEIFPDDPADPVADGSRNLQASLQRVRELGHIDVMAVQRYPVRQPDSAGGNFEERYWSTVNAPVYGPQGELSFIIHRVEDVTEFIHQQKRAGASGAQLFTIADRTRQMEIDVVLRAHELQQLNDQLRASETRLRAVFRGAATGIVITTLDGQLVEANDAFCRMLDTDLATLRSCRLDDLIHPDDLPRNTMLVGELIAGARASFVVETRYLKRQGSSIWVRVSASAPRGGEPQSINLILVIEDITRQRAAESQLASTLESMADAFFLLDRSWCFVYVNRSAEQLLQRTSTELLHGNIWELFPELNALELGPSFRQALETDKAVHFEAFYASLNSWFEVNAYPTVEGLAVYFRDVTDQKLQADLLAASEERFRLVAQATSNAIWDWDLATDTVWWSGGMQTLFGYAPEDLASTSQSWSAHLHPDDATEVLDRIHALIHGDDVNWSAQYRFLRHDGSVAEVIDRGFVIRDAANRPLRMVGGMTDITAQRALEEQLQQSQRLETVGQLTGGVAHDFNNLLTVILGNAELIAEQLHDQHLWKLYELAEMISTAARRGSELTQRLLAFARRQTLAPKVVDLNILVATMDGLLRRTLGEHVEIALVAGTDLWSALVDPAQLESALLNLCINARDAMPGGGRLTIETSNTRLDDAYAAHHAEVVAGEYVLLTVSDTGSGIAPELLERVFDPFFTTKGHDKGTGLGLSMVYGFVKQSRGHIALYSEPGLGTTIRLYLPRYLGADGVADDVDDVSGLLVGSDAMILLVEDDELVRSYAQNQLEALGYYVVAVANGPEALAIISGPTPIDLLFTDIIMPGGMSGRELAQQARQIRPALRLLFTSGYTGDIFAFRDGLTPDVALLPKPYTRLDLARKIFAALNERIE